MKNSSWRVKREALTVLSGTLLVPPVLVDGLCYFSARIAFFSLTIRWRSTGEAEREDRKMATNVTIARSACISFYALFSFPFCLL